MTGKVRESDLPPRSERCANCRFVRGETVMECRFNPPVKDMEWPRVTPDDWCGKHTRNDGW